MPAVDLIIDPEQQGGVSQRTFIKGVVAAGATVSTTAYLFRSSGVFAEAPAQGVEALRHNDYKVPLVRNLVRRALRGGPA